MAWLALARARVANGLPPRTPLAAPAAPRKSIDRPEGPLPGNWLAGANHWRYAVGNVKRGRQGSFVTF